MQRQQQCFENAHKVKEIEVAYRYGNLRVDNGSLDGDEANAASRRRNGFDGTTQERWKSELTQIFFELNI